ncbi:glutaredoxin family protein [Ferrimonas pelagia]|uniref:Glutaredoxin domain-containing protein n=1 Tax=Ferrimonas pelagia TaxID=1177826 RepID=A0ABP9EX60_9GAMM
MDQKRIVGLALLLGIGAILAGAIYQLGAGDRLARHLNQAYGAEVVLYSASWCGVCDHTRAYLTERGHPFVEVDMEQDPKAGREFAQFGGHGVPFLLVKGNTLRGFQPREIERLMMRPES